MSKLTPAQEQYMQMKKQHPDCLLLFRIGDFYEAFYEDAKTAHKILGITLTARDKNAENLVPMAGIPHHALEKYLPKLVRAGCKVAIADQIGEVVPGRLVQRAITQIITPGTWVEEGKGSCYLLALAQNNDQRHIAWGDRSLGVRKTRSFHEQEKMLKFVLQLAPVEILLAEQVLEKAVLETRIQDHLQAIISIIPTQADSSSWLMHTLGVSSLVGFGDSLRQGRDIAIVTLFSYLQRTQDKIYVRRLEYRQDYQRVALDALTIKNLELFQSSYQANKKQSLFGVIDTCVTPMGSRLLHQRLQEPINDIDTLHTRHEQIATWYVDRGGATHVRTMLQSIGDVSRVIQKISTGTGQSIGPFVQLKNRFVPLRKDKQFRQLIEQGLSADEFIQIEQTIQLRDSMIRDEIVDPQDRMRSGCDDTLDGFRRQADQSDEILLAYQQEIVAKTGIPVKLKYVTHQGYFLEVTPKDMKRFETFFVSHDEKRGCVRAQTLKTGQRYLSSYLQSIEIQVKQAQEDLISYQITKLQELTTQLLTQRAVWEELTDLLAQLDLTVSMAQLAHEQRWTKPVMTNGFDLEIIGGRHPVVERFLPLAQSFIPNDSILTSADYFHLITGPNMGGKSTYMRQQALIVLLAHAGLWVPATQATLGLVDGIYARIGSGDILVQQQSTFMTEMLETAAILHTATARSLVIFDELGRGTSTYDGLAIAKAVCVYLTKQIKCKTLFATHYHELIDLEEQLPGFTNRSVSVYETDKEVVFLKKIVRGGASKSYGLDVAQLAGIPTDVLGLARDYLQTFEQEASVLEKEVSKPVQQGLGLQQPIVKDVFLMKLRQKYAHLDINTLTPIQALGILEQILEELREEK